MGYRALAINHQRLYQWLAPLLSDERGARALGPASLVCPESLALFDRRGKSSPEG